MASEPQIIYLEPDDEITSVVRRLREADAARLVLVAPGRTKATSSAVALRLLAAVAADEGRELALVADPLGRTLAGEAGIAAFASVADATAGGTPGVEATPAPRAAIHVVRPPDAERSTRPAAPGDETRAVPVAAPSRRAPRPSPRVSRRVPGRRSRPLWPLAILMVAGLAMLGWGAATVLPGATVRITPQARPVGPVSYDIASPVHERVSGAIPLTMSGKATGDHVDRVAAAGTVVFQSGNPGRCRVPQGTRLAAGDVVFETAETVVVPEGKFTGQGIKPGTKSVGVAAVEPGAAGNVPAGAIDTIQDAGLTFCLRGFPNTSHRLVDNPEATGGGAENHAPEVLQADVEALAKQISDALVAQLATALAEHDDLVVVTPDPAETPTVDIPKDLVGKRGDETFELSGRLAYDRSAVKRADVEAAARERLTADRGQFPAGTSIIPGSIRVTVGAARLNGDAVSVATVVTAQAAPDLHEATIRHRLAGLTPAEAQAALGDVGNVAVGLWPAWVSRIPSTDWRVSIQIVGAPVPSRAASESP